MSINHRFVYRIVVDVPIDTKHGTAALANVHGAPKMEYPYNSSGARH